MEDLEAGGHEECSSCQRFGGRERGRVPVRHHPAAGILEREVCRRKTMVTLRERPGEKQKRQWVFAPGSDTSFGDLPLRDIDGQA
jgi:hypothetical protein